MTAEPGLIFEGAAIPIQDGGGHYVDDVDTDQIYHNAHLAVTDKGRMGEYAFGNLEGWRDFPRRARPGDIILVGANFGAGSSRQHAVDCFVALGVAAIIGVSFGAIYKRNAVNAAWPLIECPELRALSVKAGDVVRVDVVRGELTSLATGQKVATVPWSAVQRDIYLAGGLFAYGASVLSR